MNECLVSLNTLTDCLFSSPWRVRYMLTRRRCVVLIRLVVTSLTDSAVLNNYLLCIKYSRYRVPLIDCIMSD